MIELVVLNYLNSNLSVKTFMEVPKNLGTFIVLEKIGSGGSEFLHKSTIAIQSYAKSLYEAAKLNEEVKKIMYKSIELEEISKIELNSDYNFTDKDTKQYRYQALYDITHY